MWRLLLVVFKTSTKKIVIVSLCILLILVAWRLDIIAEVYREGREQDPYLVLPSKIRTNPRSLSIMQGHLQEFLKSNNGAAFAAVYKFLPEGNPYLYQGRKLMADASKLLNDNFIEESDLDWIPLWNGKNSIELILEDTTVHAVIKDRQLVLNEGVVDKTTSGVVDSLLNEKLGGYYMQPINRYETIIGYVVIYVEPDCLLDLQDLQILANKLATYI